MKIFGEFEAAQRGDVGIAPYAFFILRRNLNYVNLICIFSIIVHKNRFSLTFTLKRFTIEKM